MRWVTRKHIRVNRTATAWLVRRFVDPQAEFVFVEPHEVARVQGEQDATGFDASGARFSNDGGVTSFEQILAAYGLADPVLHEFARIVHAADVAGQEALAPEAPGLQLISRGFPLVSRDDHETVERASFLYAALYAALQERSRG